MNLNILFTATPPNAIVFSSGAIRVFDMVLLIFTYKMFELFVFLFQIKTGIVMNIIGFLVIFLAAITWMPKIYGIDDEATRRFYGINTTTFPATTIG
jgi:di/tricarboxylate transporter